MLRATTRITTKSSWVMLWVLALSLLVSACGFKMKQPQTLPFNTLYTNISANTALGAQLRRLLQANSPNLRLVTSPELAEVQLLETENHRYLRELSLDPSGNVEDYELQLIFSFTLIDRAGQPLLAPTTLLTNREIPNNPDAVQAKQMEIDTMFQNMELNLVDRLLRRLTAPDVEQAYLHSLRQQDASTLPTAQPPASATQF